MENEEKRPDLIYPIDLLGSNEDRKTKKYLDNLWNPLLGASMGFGCAIVKNFGFRKPAFSGIQAHFLWVTAGGVIGYILDNKRNEHFAKRDATLRHYMELHPDDFPPIQRTKYADVLQRWVPIR